MTHPNDFKVQRPSIAVSNVIPLYKLDVKCLTDIQDRPQTWLWDGFIPNETCTLIAGVPGIGKSQFLMWLASVVSVGAQFTLNSLDFSIQKGTVLIIACEDNEASGIKPRLTALQADLSNIHVLRCAIDESSQKRRLVALDNDIPAIEEFIESHPDLRLIIIDPISGFSGKTRDHIDVEVRNLLNKLNELAEKYKIAIVLNKHLRKPKGDGISAAINEVAGSGAWVAVVRQSFVIAPYHENPDVVLFSNLKVNLNRKNTESFGYKIHSFVYQNSQNEKIETSKLVWEQATYQINADDAINKDSFEKGKIPAAVKFITEYLEKHGQSLVFNIKEAALKAGISHATFYRAKDQMPIEETKGIIGKSMWMFKKD